MNGLRLAGKLPDPLDAGRIQSDERQCEPGPDLHLHLLQDVLGGDDEDPLTPTTAYQLGQDHSDLDRLAQADSVGEQMRGRSLSGSSAFRTASVW